MTPEPRAATVARGRLRRSFKLEPAAYAALVALALGLRLLDLGSRPFHHDESQDAYFSWVLFDQGSYAYNPLLHGPLRFYLTTAMYGVFGVGDVSARLAPALMGTTMVGLTYWLRKQLGHGGALVAAVLLAVGPTFLYFSRFAREDIYIACITLGLIVVVMHFLDTPRRRHPALMGALLAASFATKESTFITVFVAGTFFAPLALWQIRRDGWRDAPLVRTVTALGWRPWASGVAAFWLVFAVLFTVFFTNPGGLWDGIHDGLAYWLGQQPVARGGEPAGFYAFLLAGEEWPVVGLAAVGIVAIARAPSVGRWLLVWTFAMSLAVYSWASEKFAWLLLHPLLPLLLIAGIGAQALWAARDRAPGRAGLALAVLGALYVGYASYTVNARHSADPRELLVSTQSSRQVLGVRDEVRRLARRSGAPLSVAIDTNEGATFPWAWYFRDLQVSYVDMAQAGSPQAEVVILTDAARTRLLPELAAYDGRRFDFRVWWVKDYGAGLKPVNWVPWMIDRTPWNPTGGMPEWLYVRRDV